LLVLIDDLAIQPLLDPELTTKPLVAAVEVRQQGGRPDGPGEELDEALRQQVRVTRAGDDVFGRTAGVGGSGSRWRSA
jgi:hypothetical protein